MRTVIKVGGAIVSAISTAVSTGLDALSVKPDISWAWITLVSFVVFVGIVAWGWGEASWKLSGSGKVSLALKRMGPKEKELLVSRGSELARGLSENNLLEVSVEMSNLCLYGIVEEQPRVTTDVNYPERYWKLTSLGKEVNLKLNHK